MIEAVVGTEFEATYTAGQSGLSPEYRVDDNEGNTVIPASGDVIELGTTGVYSAIPKPTAPGTADRWTIIWSPDGSFDAATNDTEDLVTYASTVPVPPVPPLTPISGDGAEGVGPCQAWTDGDAVALCCEGAESDTSIFDDAIVAASQTLYALVRRFSGTCGPVRVRPCGRNRCAGPWPFWSGFGWHGENPHVGCGCQSLSRVRLAGRVREILEVTIDGEIVDADTYRIDNHRWLTRTPDPGDPDTRLFWPSCQDQEQPETAVGTFSVLYTHGVDPPVAGQMAAAELACAIHQTCNADGDDECPLPTGTIQVIRQGITVNVQAFLGWGYDPAKRQWQTGMPLVDAFLNAYNPDGQRKGRTRIWSPDMVKAAPKLGV